MRRETWRRGLGRLGLVAAALASIATSQPDWSLDDSAAVPEIRLDTNQPEEVRHFSVRSSQSHTVSVRGDIHWDRDAQTPAAAVRVTIVADDGTLLREEIERVGDSFDDDGELQDATLHVGQSTPCEAAPCEAGYTVSLALVDGHPDESVRINYRFVAAIAGTGTDEPDDAFVDVVEN